MKVWLIFLQADDHTWLEAAWDDDATAENHSGWKDEVDRCKKIAHENNYEMRICSTVIAGVYELFDPPELKSVASGGQIIG